MKLIKNILLTLLAGLILLGQPSCVDDFLEQPSDAVITIDSVFADPDRAMSALFQVYSDANMDLNHGLAFLLSASSGPGGYMGFGNGSMMWGYTDEAWYSRPSAAARWMTNGTWGPDQPENRSEWVHPRIVRPMRSALIFIENAHRVPYGQTSSWNWDEAFKNQAIAEAKFWLAFYHFENVKRHGGVPILHKTPSFISTGSGLSIEPSGERQSLKACFDYILKLCDEMIPHLPDSYPSSQIGRINKGAALALKAKTLLFAASPLYNEAPFPISYGDDRDTLIRFINPDPNRWEKARDAAKMAVDWAEANGYELLDDPAYSKSDNYLYATCVPVSQTPLNKEVILDRRHGDARPPNHFFQSGCATWLNANNAVAGAGINFVRKYFRTVDGMDVNIPNEGTFPELKATMKQMEPRFHSIIWVPGEYGSSLTVAQQVNFGGRDTCIFWYYKGGLNGNLTLAKTSNPNTFRGPYEGFFYIKKWYALGNPANNPRLGFPLFRLPELYLNYAEAANEINPNDPLILDYLNKIRTRGGLPDFETVPASSAKIGDKDLMREEIIRERAIELWGEEHRYFDVRRWKIAEVNGGPWDAIHLYENGTGTWQDPAPGWTLEQWLENYTKISYMFGPGRGNNSLAEHVWEPQMYFYPWKRNEINKGIIEQNPGWK